MLVKKTKRQAPSVVAQPVRVAAASRDQFGEYLYCCCPVTFRSLADLKAIPCVTMVQHVIVHRGGRSFWANQSWRGLTQQLLSVIRGRRPVTTFGHRSFLPARRPPSTPFSCLVYHDSQTIRSGKRRHPFPHVKQRYHFAQQQEQEGTRNKGVNRVRLSPSGKAKKSGVRQVTQWASMIINSSLKCRLFATISARV
jgi:hypothetical protein